MRVLDLIIKKRDGGILTTEEIGHLIAEFNKNNVPDYQMAAFLMAIYFQGLNARETTAFTAALAESGKKIDFSSLGLAVVDKHSSGGVGDKVTLVLAPLVAAAGVPLAKISGRGLGFTGGTIDKLESIPGFSSRLSVEKFVSLVQKNNLAIMAQTERLIPADGKLYALRDVTGTVENISLIAASIMSKKIAAGADAILLDVKMGKGAFMKNRDDAFHLAETMVRIGNEMDRRVVSAVTDMNQPLGFAVGNVLEIKEAIAVLEGEGPADVETLSVLLGGHLLALVGKVRNPEEGQEELLRLLKNGVALEKFKQLVVSQGGNSSFLDNPSLLPQAKFVETIKTTISGYIHEIDARKVGKAAAILGAGRFFKGEQIDPSVGIVLKHKVGNYVSEGDVLAYIHANKEDKLKAALKEIAGTFSFGEEVPEGFPLVYGVIPPFPS
ncbi:MAG: thymidine phosphorylase [Firmicutes bacterium]|nr:thymidine phosphorylase [Bacillota bacterium]